MPKLIVPPPIDLREVRKLVIRYLADCGFKNGQISEVMNGLDKAIVSRALNGYQIKSTK